MVQMARIGDVDRLAARMRLATTNDVSSTGTASTSSGRTSVANAAVFRRPCTEIAASVKPSSSAPESPMKIRAG